MEAPLIDELNKDGFLLLKYSIKTLNIGLLCIPRNITMILVMSLHLVSLPAVMLIDGAYAVAECSNLPKCRWPAGLHNHVSPH